MKTAKTKPPKSVSRFTLHESASASALILAVVLTSLLAIIGVMFVMIARVDKMATSAISENKELNFAVETVVAKISQELVLDVPGMPKGQEYYDYPDANNAWLASLEPYQYGPTDYRWRQISDVYNRFGPVELGLKAAIIPDNQKPSEVGDSNSISGYPADADGDGVADSNWVIIPDMTSNKGKPIYAAIRVVDNGGMLNVNTAYKFDPNVGPADANLIDGSNQTQINLLALSERGSTSNPLGKLDDARFGSEPHNLNDYIKDVVWRYNEPNGAYTPFDIGDELKLRNRYILNYNLMVSRIEELWENVYDVGPRTPIPTSAYPFSRWPNCTILGTVEPNDDYDYRHISTTYNMDRIIDPNGRKMLNINDANVSSVYDKIIDANLNIANAREVAAQIAVNLIDFRDGAADPNVTTLDVNGTTYYGFERPCVYISELAYRFRKLAEPGPISYTLRRSYAIEIYKPYYPEDNYPEPNQWRLNITGYGAVDVRWWGTKHLHVVCLNDPCAPISPSVNFELGDDDPNFLPSAEVRDINYNTVVTSVSLERLTDAGWISVDSVEVPTDPNNWLVNTNEGTRSFKRDITHHKCIRRLWDTSGSLMASHSLGRRDPNYIFSESPDIMIQAHPADSNFTNIGEIGMVFVKSAYSEDPNAIGSTDTEATVRIDFTKPEFQQILKYLTVFDPTVDGIDNDGDGEIDETDPNKTLELKVPGRININTAPWYVIAQLPWMQYQDGTPFKRAKAVSDYRDNTLHGFKNIGELMLVNEMQNLGSDTKDNLNTNTPKGPDLTDDTAQDDFEERDVIFARISNLVTVRSDVFTAYILVRIGKDGPQKRVMAILDRSNVYTGDGKVRIVALHPVPDPR